MRASVRAGRRGRRERHRLVTALLGALVMVLGLTSGTAWGQGTALSGARSTGQSGPAADAQVLTWTANDDMTKYASAPSTAVAGKATIVFENSEATGNTTGMSHTLTFVTSDPDHNQDVDLNILASPNDSEGGKHTVEVTLTPGTYKYHCTIPGHQQMTGTLVVTGDDPGEDSTPPETSAAVDGDQDEDGNYLGSATVTVTASDADSGVESIEYALDGGGFQPYTAPVTVADAGEHTVRYRAADKAGNAAEEKSVDFTVVEPPDEDTTPPTAQGSASGSKNSDGHFIGRATVTVTAADDKSGVERIEYSLDGAPYVDYAEPLVLDRAGYHAVTYRAADKAGNVSEPQRLSFRIVAGGGVPAPACPEYDERETVIVGTVDTGVPNRMTKRRCTVNELIEDEKEWTSQALFLKHVRGVTEGLVEEGVLVPREQKLINRAAKRSGIGTPGQETGYRDLFDGSEESFADWEQVGGGKFGLNDDGSMTSDSSVEGMGMLWYPKRKYGDFSLKLQFRDDAPGDGRANSGVFARFPDVHDHPEEPRPEWVAIKYGHELQILDRPDGDMYKTGSVYGFDRVGLAGAGVTPKGTWNDYEIRVVGQHYEIYRNGTLINEFDNNRGQVFEPPRSDDPGTDGRRYASGYVGLQVHSTTDVVSYRNVRIKEL
ncbi:OmpL47-type beta-barrel domain-containing protein [Streptomyces qinglanensis]|uniref:Copper binding protein, plastocyanin/azurin family n=1 Tax=Streptomyces qinglanensis TaxID=943816 RepID=A0A1H9TPA2_9ACTN|nr:family 16 glycoside hydrolase [Streptomyces qinglanensis]SER98824.1 Copper binding protein, plastocyanin/azurin family [Streptomyces qinglanensis]